jgi:Domain of unknown function (DUF6989)
MHDVPRETRRIQFVLGTMALLLALNVVSAVYELGWQAVTGNVALVLLLDGIYLMFSRDVQLGQWLLFGLAAGWVELCTDWWLVRSGTLVYPADEPMIWASPAYMPFAWAVILVQIGTLGAWLKQRSGFLQATLLTALLSGINIPIYEHLAKDAHFWFYQQTPMLFNAPLYVICAEFLLALPLVGMARVTRRARPVAALAVGAVEGLWMFPAVVVAFWLLGPCTGAVIQWPCH